MAVRRAHHGNFDALIAQSSDTAGPFSFNRGAAFELEAKFAKEINRRCEVIDDDSYVVHSFERHVFNLRELDPFRTVRDDFRNSSVPRDNPTYARGRPAHAASVHAAMGGSFMRAASSGQRWCPCNGSTIEALAYTRANGSRASIMRSNQSAAWSRFEVSKW